MKEFRVIYSGFIIIPWLNFKLSFCFQGTLKGFDQTINIILDESHERVYSTTQGVEQVVLGLHIIRGDNVSV